MLVGIFTAKWVVPPDSDLLAVAIDLQTPCTADVYLKIFKIFGRDMNHSGAAFSCFKVHILCVILPVYYIIKKALPLSSNAFYMMNLPRLFMPI